MNHLLPQTAAAREAFIERIVAEVLRRLPGKGAKTSAAIKPAEKQQDNGVNALHVDRKLVAMADVEHRLTSIARLTVPPGAVLTPTVRDELRRRKIALAFADAASETKPASKPAAELLLAAAGIEFSPASLAKRLKAAAKSLGPFACPVGAIGKIAESLSEQGRAIVLTNEPHAAACLANRQKMLRAAVCRNAADVEAACRSIGMNVAAVDPRETNPWQLKQIAEALAAAEIASAKYAKQLKGGE